MSTSRDLLAGQMLGNCRILEQVGQGGMGTVYRAYQASLDRVVAVKVISPLLVGDDVALARFKREAQTVASFRHPHILTVYDFGEQDGLAYLISEFAAGGTLRARLGAPVALADSIAVLRPIGSALDYAHSRGIVHRDVKPGNVLVHDDGTLVLSDFGLALQPSGVATQLTVSGLLLGTPAYMAPEQGLDSQVGPSADLYALGVIAYELLTGSVPFSGPTPVSIMLAHIQTPLPPVRSRNPALSEAVERVLARALAKQPADRYASAAALVTALEAIVTLDEKTVTSTPKSVTLDQKTVTFVTKSVTPSLEIGTPHGDTATPLSAAAAPQPASAAPQPETVTPPTESVTPLAESVTPATASAAAAAPQAASAAPPPETVTPLGKSVTPRPESVTPRPESVTSAPESVTPGPRGVLLGAAAAVGLIVLAAAALVVFRALQPPPSPPEPAPVWQTLTAAGPIAASSALALDRSGFIYVFNDDLRLVKLSPSGQHVGGPWGSFGGPIEFDNPRGIALDANGNLFITESGLAERIEKLTPLGQDWLQGAAHLGSGGFDPGQFSGPDGIAVAPDGSLIVADRDNDRIQKLSSTGQPLAHWGGPLSGSEAGQFFGPRSVAVDAQGNVYVADSGNDRIQKLSPTGQPLAQWGSTGSAAGQFSGPSALAVDTSGNIFVADAGNDRIQKLSPSGQSLAQWGTSGSGDEQLSSPGGIAIDASGAIYVADSGNHRIQKLTFPTS